MKKTNKWLALLLSLVMVLSLLPVSVLAADLVLDMRSIDIEKEVIFGKPEPGDPVDFTVAASPASSPKEVNVVLAQCELDENGVPINVRLLSSEELGYVSAELSPYYENPKIANTWVGTKVKDSVNTSRITSDLYSFSVSKNTFAENTYTSFLTDPKDGFHYYLGTYLVDGKINGEYGFDFKDYVKVSSVYIVQDYPAPATYSYSMGISGTKYTDGEVKYPLLDSNHTESLSPTDVLVVLFANKVSISDLEDYTVTLSDKDFRLTGVYTYDGNSHQPTLTVREADKTGLFDGGWLTRGKDYYIDTSDGEVPSHTLADTYEFYVKGMGTYTGYQRVSYEIEKATNVDNPQLTHSDWTYGDTDIPKATLTSRNINFDGKEDIDYTVTYYKAQYVGLPLVGEWRAVELMSDMSNAPAGDYVAVLRFKGDNINGILPSDMQTHFKINPKDIANCTVTLSDPASPVTYGDVDTFPAVTVTDGTTLTEGTHYTVSYSVRDGLLYRSASEADFKNADTYYVTVTGKGSYTGSKTVEFKINRKSLNDYSVTPNQGNFTYDGSVKYPTTVTVAKEADELVLNKDYTLSYATNQNGPYFALPTSVNKGTYYVKATGIGNYAGELTASYTINPASIAGFYVTTNTKLTYNGEDQKSAVTATVWKGRKVLTPGTDYELVFEKNGNTATEVKDASSETVSYTVTAKGINNYTGESSNPATLTVAPKQLYVILPNTIATYDDGDTVESNDAIVTGFVGSDTAANSGTTSYTYNGSENEPSAVGTYVVKATYTPNETNGSNYVGATAYATLAIRNKSAYNLTVEKEGWKYDGDFHNNEASDKPYDLTSSNVDNVSALAHDVNYYKAVKVLGQYLPYGAALENDPTEAGDYVIEVHLKATGYEDAYAYDGFTIEPVSIVDDCEITGVEDATYTYDGEDHKPTTVTVTHDTLTPTYTVTYYKGSTKLGDDATIENAGTYYVKVDGTGNYTGSATYKIVINPIVWSEADPATVNFAEDMEFDGHDWNDPDNDTPVVSVTYGDTTLPLGKGYTLTYGPSGDEDDEDLFYADYDLTSADTHYVWVEGDDANCIGSFKASFTIAPRPVTFEFQNGTSAEDGTKTYTSSYTGNPVKVAEKALVTGAVDPDTDENLNTFVTYKYYTAYTNETDNTPTYPNTNKAGTAPVNAGTYTVVATFSGKNNYEVATAVAKLTINEPPYTPTPTPSGVGGGAAVSTNKVNLPDNLANGTVSSSHKSAAAGTTVTLTFAPADGYKLGTFGVLDNDNKVLTLTDLGNGKYSFEMPASEVTVKATFAAEKESTFVDVTENEYYSDAVEWAVETGVTNGVDATHFNPNVGITRAQVVTFLWRAAGEPEVVGNADKFTDVGANEYYAKAVAWAIEQAITKGTSDTTFSPDVVCTRAQIVTFLARFAGVKDAAAGYEHGFDDVNAADYYNNAVAWAKDNKVTEGTSADLFSPNVDCTRGQVVTFLYRWMVK